MLLTYCRVEATRTSQLQPAKLRLVRWGVTPAKTTGMILSSLGVPHTGCPCSHSTTESTSPSFQCTGTTPTGVITLTASCEILHSIHRGALTGVYLMEDDGGLSTMSITNRTATITPTASLETMGQEALSSSTTITTTARASVAGVPTRQVDTSALPTISLELRAALLMRVRVDV